VVLLLIGAYRALGGAATRPADSAQILDSLHRRLAASADALRQELQAGPAPGHSGAVEGRKLAAAAQQALDRIEPPDSDRLLVADARALLAAAADDLSWAWRLLQADAASEALAGAAVVLADHAAECCAQAEPLLLSSGGGEPGDRS
jgi:hypothetical protein